MNSMKKYIFGVGLLVGMLFFAQPLLAEGEPSTSGGGSLKDAIATQNSAFGGDKGAGYGEPSDARLIAAAGIQVFLGFMGTLFSIYTLSAGALWMMSGGNEEKITRARSMLLHGVIGVFVIFISYTLVYFIYKAVVVAQGEQFGSYWRWGTVPKGAQQVEGPDPLSGNADPLESLVPTPDNPKVKQQFFGN